MTPLGVVTMIGGRPGVPGSADGMGEDALFKYPGGVAIDDTGNVYVIDSFNHVVRKGIPVSQSPPVISGERVLPNGIVGATFSHTLSATGGTLPYDWSVSSGALPAGLYLSSAGVISGIPTAATTENFSIRVAGNDGFSSTDSFSLETDFPPRLQIQLSDGAPVLSWPASATAFFLETSSSLGSAATWQPVGPTPTQVGNDLVVTGSVSSGAGIFRLKAN